ncbi:MAG: hypothetical protein AAGC82_17580 [Pseudomonadota bacterium]
MADLIQQVDALRRFVEADGRLSYEGREIIRLIVNALGGQGADLSDVSVTDEKVAVNAAGAADYLANVLIAGTGVTFDIQSSAITVSAGLSGLGDLAPLDTVGTAEIDDAAVTLAKLASDVLPAMLYLMVQDDGATGQTTTGTAADLAGMWAAATPADTGLAWGGPAGELTVTTDGTMTLSAMIGVNNASGSDHELHLELQEDTGGGYSTIFETKSPVVADGSNGWAMIPGFVRAVTSGNTYKLRVYDTGGAGTIGTGPQSYVSVMVW